MRKVHNFVPCFPASCSEATTAVVVVVVVVAKQLQLQLQGSREAGHKKIAIEAIRGDLTIVQIVSRYQVAESLVLLRIHRWKKQLLDHGGDVFDGKIVQQEVACHIQV